MKYIALVFIFFISLSSYSQCDLDVINLSGLWTAFGYNCSGSDPDNIQEVNISHDLSSDNIIAIKVTSDGCVTPGNVVFQGSFNGIVPSFNATFATGSGATNQLVQVNSETYFVSEGITFTKYVAQNAIDLNGEWSGSFGVCQENFAVQFTMSHDLNTGAIMATILSNEVCPGEPISTDLEMNAFYDGMSSHFTSIYTYTLEVGAPQPVIANFFVPTAIINNNKLIAIGEEGSVSYVRVGSEDQNSPITLINELEEDCQITTANTLHNDYACQYYCIAQNSNTEFYNNGESGYAEGFVEYVWQAFESRNDGPLYQANDCSISSEFSLILPSDVEEYYCFAKEGLFDHYFTEMLPVFLSFCFNCPAKALDIESWDQNHDLFLENAVVPCFLEFLDMPDLFNCTTARNTEGFARILREITQELCIFSTLPNQGITSIGSAFINDFLGGNFCCISSDLIVGVEYKSLCADFDIIDVGQNIFDEAKDWLNPFSRSLPADTMYFIDLDTQFYEINNGMLTITSSPWAIAQFSPVLNVFSYTQNSVLTLEKQFLITDADSDGDLLGDNFEINNGLNPNVSNLYTTDLDNDGLNDFIESLIGSDPFQEDSDGDGFTDAIELNANSDFNNENNFPTQNIFVSESIGNQHIEIHDFSYDYDQYVIRGDLSNSEIRLIDFDNNLLETIDNQTNAITLKMEDYSYPQIKLVIQNTVYPELHFEAIILE